MGLLIDGSWQDRWYDTDASGGSFEREVSSCRSWVTADGTAGPSGEAGFPAEADRYHLYVSYACPWAHRALIWRTLKGLDRAIGMSVVHWFMGDEGWTFEPDADGIVGDALGQRTRLHHLYTDAQPEFTGRVTVPVLWDTQRRTIVSNESSEIVRMFDSAFDTVGATGPRLYPASHADAIDRWNERIYETVNNGVYRAGFATTQQAYDAAVHPLFDTLDAIEQRLGEHRYLVSDVPLEADWRLFPTLLRFDPVYHGHFKCNLRRIADYPNLSGYLRELYQWPGIRQTVNLDHAKRHYYASHDSVNPTRIVPAGPLLDLDAPHGR